MKRPDACAATDQPHRRITLSGWPATVQDPVSFLLGTVGLFLLSWGEGVEAVILLAALVPFFCHGYLPVSTHPGFDRGAEQSSRESSIVTVFKTMLRQPNWCRFGSHRSRNRRHLGPGGVDCRVAAFASDGT